MTRPLLCCALALAALTAPPTASAAPPAARQGCVPANARMLAANKLVSVFWRYTRRYGMRQRGLFTCARADKRPRPVGPYGPTLDPFADVDGIEHVQLAGRYIAYGNGFHCERYHGDCEGRVVVRDAISGTLVATRRFLMFNDESTPNDGLAIAALRLTSSGVAALILYHGTEYEVWSIRDEAHTLLDHGPAVESDSLAVSEGRAFWVNADEVRSAPLDGAPAPAAS